MEGEIFHRGAVQALSHDTAQGSACGSRVSSELLLAHHPAERGRHPGALVEAERAGVVRCVDAEPDASLATLPEAPERVAEERCTDALLAPRATCEEHVYPAAAVRVGRRDRAGCDLVSGVDDAPERRVEALALEVALRPRFEVALGVLPVIRERLLVGGVELERVALRVERDDAQPVRPLRGGRWRFELDAQLAEDAYGVVAERLEQRSSG